MLRYVYQLVANFVCWRWLRAVRLYAMLMTAVKVNQNIKVAGCKAKDADAELRGTAE